MIRNAILEHLKLSTDESIYYDSLFEPDIWICKMQDGLSKLIGILHEDHFFSICNYNIKYSDPDFLTKIKDYILQFKF